MNKQNNKFLIPEEKYYSSYPSSRKTEIFYIENIGL